MKKSKENLDLIELVKKWREESLEHGETLEYWRNVDENLWHEYKGTLNTLNKAIEQVENIIGESPEKIENIIYAEFP